MEIEARLKEIIERMGMAYRRDVDWDEQMDSLDEVELVMACEEEFGLEISDDDAEKIRTPAQAIEYLTARQPA